MGRSCLPCTECCRGALEAHTNGVDIGYNKPCEHVTANGCGIGDARPQDPCKDYRCAWVASEHRLPDSMRPDLSGCIINLQAGVFQDYDVAEVIPTKKTIPEATKKALTDWSERHQHPLLLKEIILENGEPYRTVLPIGSALFVKSVNQMASNGHPLVPVKARRSRH